MPIARHSHQERHFDILPLTQAPPFAALVNNPNDAVPGSAGGNQIHDLAAGTAATDAANVGQLSGGGAGGDLLTGDSSTFTSGIGNWTAGAPSTVTDDTNATYAWPFAGQHNALITPNVAFGSAACPVPGTFFSGVRYAVLFVVQNEGLGDSIIVGIGDGGAGDTTDLNVGGEARYEAHVLYWTPSGDRTAVAVTVSSTAGTETIRVARCAVVRDDVLEDTILALARFPSADPDASNSPALTQVNGILGPAQGVGLSFEGDLLKIRGRNLNAEIFVTDDATGAVYVRAANGATPADLSTDGLLIEVGPDELGVILSEVNAATVQLHPTDGVTLELASASDISGDLGSYIDVIPADNGSRLGGSFSVYNGGAAAGGTGGDIVLTAGDGDAGAKVGALIRANGATPSDDGTITLRTGNSFGVAGQVLGSDGGSQTVWQQRPQLYRLAFAWNTASIATGVPIVTLAAGDVVLGAWLDVATAWNSTVSDLGDIVTATNGESLLNATVNMQSVGAGTDRRKLRDGTLPTGEASVLLGGMAVNVKVASVGISLSAGAATAFVLVSRA